MAEEEDQFYVEPEIQELQDLKPISQMVQYHSHHPKLPKEEIQQIHLKMVKAPKQEKVFQYQTFRFNQDVAESQSQQQQVVFGSNSVVEQHYNSNPCVYLRFNNKSANEICNVKYFAGVFIHRKIINDGSSKQSCQIGDILKQANPTICNQKIQVKKQDLIFDSRFQSGNLFAAYKISQYEYDLMMQNDTNSVGGSNQWFYFSVTNLLPNKNYTFSIVNFTKSDSLFNYGMAPCVYSLLQNRNIQNIEQGWKREARQVRYSRGSLTRQRSRRYYYTLTFTLSTPHEKDKLFVAHSYPYSYQKLRSFLAQKTNRNADLITRFTIGKTLSKRAIQALIIRQSINKKKDTRKAIIILARQHPGETQGSYVCQGVVDRLLSKCKQMDLLLKNYIFYVIPMVNIDGVVYGHYRCNLLGKDLNRKWDISQKQQNCPEVTSIKSFIQELSRQRQIRFILDLHGHSKKLNSFFYGNPCPEKPEVVRIYPYICSKIHRGIQYLDCTFTVEEYKRKAARVYLSSFYHLIHVYTFQSSFYAFFQKGAKVEFTPKQYRKLGSALVNGLAMQLDHQIKYQQSYEFIIKTTSKEYMNSPFVRILLELKNSKELLNIGNELESGSDSKPEQGQLNNEQMEGLKAPAKQQITSNILDNHSKTERFQRKRIKQVRDHSYNHSSKPARNIKCLQISKIHSVLPDKHQLALQPIRKRQCLPQPILSKNEIRTQMKNESKIFDFKSSEIQSCNLPNYEKKSTTQRRLSSLIQSMNNNRNNIILRVGDHIQPIQRPKVAQIHNRSIKNALSQTMIAFDKDQSKIGSQQKLPIVESANEKQRYDLVWPKVSQMSINGTRGDLLRQTQVLLNGMMSRFINDKELFWRQNESKQKYVNGIRFKKNDHLRK